MRRSAIILVCVLAAAAGAAGQSTRPSAEGKPRLDPSNPRVTPVVLAYRAARPAVVNISTQRVVTTRWGLGGADPFEEIFPSPLRRRRTVQSLGSGVIIHPDGYVVTNAHVVRRASRITVRLDAADGGEAAALPAKVISADPAHDLAVVKVDPPEGEPLPHLPLGRSDDLMIGEPVIAIGNPMGYASSLSTGVISQVNRTLEFGRDVVYEGLIQTNAPLNPGNSGGPLLNIKGDLIGINTAIRADAQNIGFAIPVDALGEELPMLLDFESLNRVIFGARVLQRNTDEGPELRVALVREGTPAAGRLKVGDRLVALNGKPLRQIPDFTCAMLAVKAGAKVALQCRRDGAPVDVTVKIAAKPKPDGRKLAESLLGLTLRPITGKLARNLRLPTDRGLLVVGVERDSPADRIGVKLKDILFQVGRRYVDDLDDLGMILEDVDGREVLRIGIVRGHVAAWVRIPARQPQ